MWGGFKNVAAYCSEGERQHRLHLDGILVSFDLRQNSLLRDQVSSSHRPELDVLHADRHQLTVGVGSELGVEDALRVARTAGDERA